MMESQQWHSKGREVYAVRTGPPFEEWPLLAERDKILAEFEHMTQIFLSFA